MGGPNITGFLNLIEQRKQQQEQLLAGAKAADTVFKSLTDEQRAAAGLPDANEFAALSAADRAGAIKGFITSQAIKERLAQMEQDRVLNRERLASVATTEALNRSRLREEQADETFRRAIGGVMGAAPAAGEGITAKPVFDAFGEVTHEAPESRTLPIEEMVRVGLQSGVDPQRMAALANALANVQATREGLGGMEFTEDPVSHYRFAQRGKSVLPSGINQAAVPKVEMIAQHDAEGNLLGFSQVDARGHATFHRYSGDRVRSMKNEAGEPIPGWYVRATGEPIDARTLVGKMTGEEQAAPAAGPAAVVGPGGKKAAPLDYESELRLAREAISKGADPDRVKANFKKRTGKEFTAK